MQLIKEANIAVDRKIYRRNWRACVKNLMENKIKRWTCKGRS